MKTYVLYHGNCPDGFGAALAVRLALGRDGVEYIPVSYGNPPPQMDPGSRVIIVDFSYRREVLLELQSMHQDLLVLDHHATAQTELAGLSFCHFDMTKSGAMLAWEWFHGKPVPKFFQYLQDRDLWRFELPQSREVSCAVRSYPHDFDVWHGWALKPEGLEGLKREGKTCLRLTRQHVEGQARKARRGYFHPKMVLVHMVELSPERPWGLIEQGFWTAPVVNATVSVSEVCERLLEMTPEAPFVACYADRADGMRQWSLRSRPEFDCSEVAAVFGGGGHKQASGFVQKL